MTSRRARRDKRKRKAEEENNGKKKNPFNDAKIKFEGTREYGDISPFRRARTLSMMLTEQNRRKDKNKLVGLLGDALSDMGTVEDDKYLIKHVIESLDSDVLIKLLEKRIHVGEVMLELSERDKLDFALEDEQANIVLRKQLQTLMERHEELQRVEAENAMTFGDKFRRWFNSW